MATNQIQPLNVDKQDDDDISADEVEERQGN